MFFAYGEKYATLDSGMEVEAERGVDMSESHAPDAKGIFRPAQDRVTTAAAAKPAVTPAALATPIQPLTKRRRLDWLAAARQLASGKSPEAVAKNFGVSLARILRNLDRSPRFRLRIDKERARFAQYAATRFNSLTLDVAEGLAAAAADGDGKVLQWLTERLELGSHAAAERHALYDRWVAQQRKREENE
jgi:hypothetical protein